MDELNQYSDLELLRELITRNGVSDPSTTTKRQGAWNSTIIGIGDDEHAEITLTDEAMADLGL